MMNETRKDEEAAIHYCLLVVIIATSGFLRPVVLSGIHCAPRENVVCRGIKDEHTYQYTLLPISTYHMERLWGTYSNHVSDTELGYVCPTMVVLSSGLCPLRNIGTCMFYDIPLGPMFGIMYIQYIELNCNSN